MALCTINKAIKPADSCAYAIGGIKALYIANFDPQLKVVGECDATETVPESITFSEGADGKWYGVSVADESVNYQNALTINGSNKYLTETISGTINQIDCSTLENWKALTLGKFHAIVVTNSDKIFIVGAKGSGLKATQFEFATGAGNGDASGITFTFEGVSFSEPILLSELPEVVTE